MDTREKTLIGKKYIHKKNPVFNEKPIVVMWRGDPGKWVVKEDGGICHWAMDEELLLQDFKEVTV